jgi:hypothetical protein
MMISFSRLVGRAQRERRSGQSGFRIVSGVFHRFLCGELTNVSAPILPRAAYPKPVADGEMMEGVYEECFRSSAIQRVLPVKVCNNEDKAVAILHQAPVLPTVQSLFKYEKSDSAE